MVRLKNSSPFQEQVQDAPLSECVMLMQNARLSAKLDLSYYKWILQLAQIFGVVQIAF